MTTRTWNANVRQDDVIHLNTHNQDAKADVTLSSSILAGMDSVILECTSVSESASRAISGHSIKRVALFPHIV